MLVTSDRATTPYIPMSIALATSMLSLSGCGGSQRSSPPIECAAADGYEVRVLEDYEDGSMSFVGFTDSTPGAIHNVEVRIIEAGGRCGSELAVVLTARGNRDWGGGFGALSSWDGDASGYDGFSFWVRSPGPSTKGFTLFLDDPTTVELPYRLCVPQSGVAGSSTVVDVNGMITVTGPVPAANACGNSFFAVLFATERWQFHRVPFQALAQAPWPNRTANGINRSAVLGRAIRMPKGSDIELWIDDFGLYRERANHVVE
jgi:hypothetical protein